MKKSSSNLQARFKLLIIFSAFAFVVFAAKENEVSRVIAKVGNEVITTAELDSFLKPWLMKYGSQYDKSEFAELSKRARQAALKQFIERKLLTQEANKLQLEIPEVEVQKEFNRIRSQFPSDEEFNKFLEKENMTEQEYKNLIKDDLKTKVLIHEKVTKKIFILPSKIHDYYQLHISEFLQPAQVHMYQILIKKKPTAEAAYKRAKEILKELKEGANFQQLARLSSDGPKKSKGGDWGIVEEGFFGNEMKAVEDAAFKLKPGHFSNIIETKYGYHIVYIDRKRISRILTEREAYNTIKQKLFMEKYSSALKDYINYLSNKTYIEILEPELDQEFSLGDGQESKPLIVNPTPTPNISPPTVKTNEPSASPADNEE